MIINIRGTHGSGKSTVVRKILDRYPNTPVITTKKKPDGYAISIDWLDRPLYVVGGYETACGGCDGIQPYSLIWPRIEEYASKGHVLFEGAMVSSSYGNIGRASEVFGNQFVFCFLDTSLNVCISRIVDRRKARGEEKELNTKNTRDKYRNVLVSIPKIRDEFKRRTVMINHRSAVPQVLGILYKG